MITLDQLNASRAKTGKLKRFGLPYAKFSQRGGRGKRREPGEMNGTEARYADLLEARRRAGEVLWYAYEATTFKLAADTRYTPDFTVMLADQTIEFHEVKGTTKNGKGARVPFVEPQNLLKVKLAAELLPFRFCIVWIDKSVPGGWGRKNYYEQATDGGFE